jgi:hypothetical protein
MRGGGDFASNTSKAGISGQSSSGTTANNTDTSGARTLDPAPDSEARQATEEWNENAMLNAGLDQKKDAGRGPTWRTPDQGADATNSSVNTSTGYDDTNRNTAPSYVHSGQQGIESIQKPKGKNLQEGGFDDDAPNASFNNEIGTDKDPARLAEQKFEERSNLPGRDAGNARDAGVSGEGQYDALKDEAA